MTFIVPTNSVKGEIVLKSFFEDKFFASFQTTLIVDNSSEGLAEAYKDKAKTIQYDKLNVEDEAITCSDFIISLGWGKIIPETIFSKAKIASINCHSSLLPDYKGGSVFKIYWAHAEDYSGATVHILSSDIDKGNIIAQQSFAINFFDTPRTILVKASECTAPLLKEAILKIEKGYTGIPQSQGRYFFKAGNLKLIIYRAYNLFARRFGLPIWLLPHKLV